MPNKLNTNPSQNLHSQAPANTMILGEHSVVYGHPALACAVDQYVHIYWQTRQDTAIHIYSALGEHHTQTDNITAHPKLKFVIKALQAFQDDLPCGLDIRIESEFSSTIGLGSSAAVLAAMLSGLNNLCQTQYNLIDLFHIGHKIIVDIQGRGSGTDLAASLAGGAIYFQPKTEKHPLVNIQKLDIQLPLILVYSGYKTPTSEVLKQVATQWQDKPNELAMLYRSMEKETRTAFKALTEENMQGFYSTCNSYQQLMTDLGVNDETLQNIINSLNSCQSIHTAKISGSGLGDCILGIGNLKSCPTQVENSLSNYQQISIDISATGAVTETV
ncbi:MAG TPA: GHMP kinase [Thiomicrospira sp.]|jgi:mevalonate kinase|nr:GHMP kinase [Thiomicrospira sp.]